MKYDICIIGVGPAAFGILESLKIKDYKGSILIIEQGSRIEERNANDKLHGFGGAGAFSDFKLMIDEDTGGDLAKYLDNNKFGNLYAFDYIEQAKEFYIKNGAPESAISNDCNDELRLANKYNFILRPIYEIIHCGTDRAIEINKNIYNYFNDLNITYLFETYCEEVLQDSNSWSLCLDDGDIYSANKVVIATGRSHDMNLSALNIEYDNNIVDLGVRCEIDEDSPMKPWFDKFYHPKLEYITPTYQDKVRTFCSNPGGYIAVEDYGDFKLVNGESFKNKYSNRTNFAILVSIPFTEPFKDGNEFARSIAKTVNRLNDGKPIVQSYRDLKHGRRTTLERLSTLKISINNAIDVINTIEPGDLSIVIPHRYMTDIIEFIDNLDKMFTGVIDNMLLYGLEAKFYSNKPKFIDNYFQVKPGLYFAGDCSGITRGIIQATAQGIYIGEIL